MCFKRIWEETRVCWIQWIENATWTATTIVSCLCVGKLYFSKTVDKARSGCLTCMLFNHHWYYEQLLCHLLSVILCYNEIHLFTTSIHHGLTAWVLALLWGICKSTLLISQQTLRNTACTINTHKICIFDNFAKSWLTTM